MIFLAEIETWPANGVYIIKDKSKMLVEADDKKKAKKKLDKHLEKTLIKKKYSFELFDSI